MNNKLIALLKQMNNFPNYRISSSLNVRKYLFDRLVIISAIISLPNTLIIAVLERSAFGLFGLIIGLAFVFASYLYFKGKTRIADFLTFLALYPLSTLVCIFVQPLPAFGLVQLAFFSVFCLAKFPLLGVWGRIIIPLVCFVLSISSFYWIEPWVTVEHEVFFNVYFLFSALIIHIVFIIQYQRHMELSRLELLAQQKDFEVSHKHLKIAPWKYSYKEDIFKPSRLFLETFSVEDASVYNIESGFLAYLPSRYQKIVRNSLNNPKAHREFDFVFKTEEKGENIYYHLRGENYFDEAGNPEELYGSIENVTTRKREEERSSYADSLLSTTMDSTINGLLVIDPRGNIKEYNKKYLKMWQLEEADIVGKRLMELVEFAPLKIKNVKDFHADIERVIEDREVETFSEIVLENDQIYEVYSKPHVHKGEVLGRMISFRDITEKRKAMDNLKNSEEKYRRLFESSADGILLLDLDERKAIDCNQQMMCLFQTEKSGILNANSLTFSPDYQPDGEKSSEKREKFFKIDKGATDIRRFEWQYQTATGKVLDTEVMVSPFTFKGKSMAIHIIRDISQRKALLKALEKKNFRLEEKVLDRTRHLQQSNAELKRSNDDLEQFAYAASHDLKEPLRMVGNFVGLLARDYEDKLDDKAHRYIKFATEGVKRMTEQMKGLLEFSLMGRSEMNIKQANLQGILAKNMLNLSIYIEERQAEVILPGTSITIMCEPVMIGLLFHNLISNGIKFNKHETPKVRIHCKKQDNGLQICVSDNGIGISEGNQKKIFEIFKRLHRPNEFEGMGMGLALCRKIVHRHGGDIWVESAPGEGSTFCFTLPNQKLVEKKSEIAFQVEN